MHLRHKPWVVVGIVCEEHLPFVLKLYGTCKTEAVDKEYIELGKRCTMHGCKGLVDFVVYKQEFG